MSRFALQTGTGLLLTALICLSSLTLVTSDVHADPPDNAEPNIRQLTPMSFGQIARPSLSTNTFTLDWQNNGVLTNGSGDGFHLGGASSGRYLLRGQPNQTVTVTGEVLDFSAQGIIVDQVHLNGPSNTHATIIDGQGRVLVRMGGIVTVEPRATVGLHYADILLTIDYE